MEELNGFAKAAGVIKGFSPDVRQEIFRKPDKINPVSIGHLPEKPEGYPHFKRLHTAGAICFPIQRILICPPWNIRKSCG